MHFHFPQGSFHCLKVDNIYMGEGEWKSLIQHCKPNGKYWYIGGVCKLPKSDITALERNKLFTTRKRKRYDSRKYFCVFAPWPLKKINQCRRAINKNQYFPTFQPLPQK